MNIFKECLMKRSKLFGIIALIAVIGLGACSSPSGGDGSGSTPPPTPKITMTTTVSGVTYIYLLGTGQATINWGDGTTDVEDLNYSNDWNDLRDNANRFSHTYSSGTKTLTVTGNITGFSSNGDGIASALNVTSCPGLIFLDFKENLTTLNLSKNTALEYLNFDGNQLTALDLSKNTALKILDCGYNDLASLTITGCNALEKVYCNDNLLADTPLATVLDNLPDRTTSLTQGYIDVSGNYGASGTIYTTAKTDAQGKNWDVDD